jgi:hypothetical protein
VIRPGEPSHSESVRQQRLLPASRPRLRKLYVCALVIRVVAGLLAYGLTMYADLPMMEDALFYEDIGYEVSQQWLAGRPVDFDTLPQGAQTARLLIAAIAAFYFVTDGVRAVPLLIIVYAAITAFVPIYMYRVARELEAPEIVARRTGWLVALSPAFVFWSGSLYKEGLTLLLLSIAAYHTMRLHKEWRSRSALIVTVAIVALWWLRYYLATLLAVAIALSLLWRRGRDTERPQGIAVFVRQAIVGLAFMIAIIGVGAGERSERLILEDEKGLLVELDVRRADSARQAASGYLPEERIDNPEAALRYFPLGLAYFLTVPFPWHLGSVRQSMIIPENLFWWALYPMIVIGMRRAWKPNMVGTFFLLLLTAGMCATYALLSANVGTTYRMRSQVWLLWAPFAAWGWEVLRERRRRRAAVRVPPHRPPVPARPVMR